MATFNLGELELFERVIKRIKSYGLTTDKAQREIVVADKELQFRISRVDFEIIKEAISISEAGLNIWGKKFCIESKTSWKCFVSDGSGEAYRNYFSTGSSINVSKFSLELAKDAASLSLNIRLLVEVTNEKGHVGRLSSAQVEKDILPALLAEANKPSKVIEQASQASQAPVSTKSKRAGVWA